MAEQPEARRLSSCPSFVDSKSQPKHATSKTQREREGEIGLSLSLSLSLRTYQYGSNDFKPTNQMTNVGVDSQTDEPKDESV